MQKRHSHNQKGTSGASQVTLLTLLTRIQESVATNVQKQTSAIGVCGAATVVMVFASLFSISYTTMYVEFIFAIQYMQSHHSSRRSR
jgi:hypothetical protein